MPETISPGDRVRYAYSDLTGTVKRISGEYAYIRWDHYGLAIAALGSQADLQIIARLEKIKDA